MFGIKSESLFSQSKELERQIDEFVDTVSEIGIIFKRAVRDYLSNGSGSNFDQMVEQVSEMESKADKIKKDVETALYEDTLIPDARSDVLRLLEHLDQMIGLIQGNCYRLSIQKPSFPKDFHEDLVNLTDVVIDSAESLCISVRSFFRDIKTVRDNAHKVTFYEKESDKQTSNLQRKIFESSLALDQKMHLRYFVEKIDQIADQAEDIADELQIYSIKRSI
jgi:predicted phosphate transport protein (TIGR00153 family)|tara:strand:- start:793 stop:1455 length:663 start_codon:yes stop_codon:yes gene_type:complete